MKSNKLMITCALCGGGTTRKQSPYVPLTPDELVADSIAAVQAGACILHIHVRDDEGNNTMETERFVQVVTMIREALRKNNLDAIINVTSSGTKFSEDMRVADLTGLLPEMCSYDPGTLNWANSYIFLNTPAFLERLGYLTQELDIKPEIEIFDAGMLGNVEYYLKKGVLKGPLHYQLVLDVPGGMPGNIDSINHLVSKLPADCTWQGPHALYAGRSGRRLRQPAGRPGGQCVPEEGRTCHQRTAGGAGGQAGHPGRPRNRHRRRGP